jgi:hypothetical protein
MKVLFIPKKLEKRLVALFDKLVPGSGSADTLEGEIVRAINKILYRFYNDGDVWHKGYGIETAGPAAAFLVEESPISVRAELDESDGLDGPAYERALHAAAEKIVTYVEKRGDDLTECDLDMLDSEPKYEIEEEEHCWGCEEPVDDCVCGQECDECGCHEDDCTCDEDEEDDE